MLAKALSDDYVSDASVAEEEIVALRQGWVMILRRPEYRAHATSW